MTHSRLFLFLVASFALACGDDDAAGVDGTDAGARVDAASPDDGGADASAEDAASPDDAGADAGADATAPVSLECRTDGDFDELGACAERARIESELTEFAVERPPGSAAHLAARMRLAEQLEAFGFEVELHDYGSGVNVIGTRTGSATPDDVAVVSAHYDGTPGCPGADDNASGVAGALEAARVLGMIDHDRTLVVAFWDEEERGLLGSSAWAERAHDRGTRVVVSFVFEMIGYQDAAPDTQDLPPGFGLLFAEAAAEVAANDDRGDFIALVAGDDASAYTDALVASSRRIGHKAFPIELSASNRSSSLLGDLRRSDHDAFWVHGWPAMMITDTANFRNPNYHCAAGPDVIEDLDLAFARDNVAITIAATALALDDGAPTSGVGPSTP